MINQIEKKRMAELLVRCMDYFLDHPEDLSVMSVNAKVWLLLEKHFRLNDEEIKMLN